VALSDQQPGLVLDATGQARPSNQQGCRLVSHRRVIVLGAVGATALLLAGCANKPLRAANADGTYCFRVNSKSRHRTCTPEPVPGAAVDAQAKGFQVDAAALTVYVVRKRWADAINVIDLAIDGRRVASTVPHSFVRLELEPGSHRIAALWQGEPVERLISGAGGDLIFVELVGSVWSGTGNYRLEIGDRESSSARVRASRPVADRDLRAR